ncbi:MAG TPA: FAD/NAD(P)-binding oxidoreductase [Pseudonocardiaceae bacterium]|jgi:NADPH-dependent 2,4-dienoyl-CoA reductase/sulfur reductase-like enzyme|nr:FAD/NAD(P)-binding oxidoreductase [Pseudonocardiaceae bacterium]
MEQIVIAGAGLAALRAAEHLRELGFDGRIVLVGDEPHRPYHRPALSKQIVTGELKPQDLPFPAYADLDVRWRLNTQAQGLDLGRRVIELPGGEELPYDGLIIATGVQPRNLAGAPRHDPRVHVLRTLADAEGLLGTLRATKGRVAIIGTGFTGCELAGSLRETHRDVTLIGRSGTLFGNVLGPELSDTLRALHQRNGVDLALGVTVRTWAPSANGIALVLSDERLLLADCVVIAVGSMPNTRWLADSGLVLDDGVLCEATCHAVGATDVMAAGDVACWPNLRFDGVPRRVEHWLNAIEMGRAAAANLLAGRGKAEMFTPVPRFWSEQHHVRIQAAGMPSLADQRLKVDTRSGGKPESVSIYARNGNTIGVVGLDRPRTVLTLTAQLTDTAWPRLRPQHQGNVFRPFGPQVVELPVQETA